MRSSAFIVVLCLAAGPVYAGQTVLPISPLENTPLISSEGAVPLWSQMPAKQRAKLWPLLDRVTRSAYWRDMSVPERKALREHLSQGEREKIRRRYSLPTTQARTPVVDEKFDALDCHDRGRMREQIVEVHLQQLRKGRIRRAVRPNEP